MAPRVKPRSTSAPQVPAPALAQKQHMLVSLNFPQCSIGMGTRYAVATRGRKWVHLFYVPTLTGFSVSPEAFAAMRPRYADEVRPKKMGRMLKAKRALYDGLQLQYSEQDADRAKATLKAMQ